MQMFFLNEQISICVMQIVCYCHSSPKLSPHWWSWRGRSTPKRRTLVAPDMNLSLDQSEGSLLSDDFLDTPDDLDINVDDIDTPDETDSLEFITNGNDLEWEGKKYAVLHGSGKRSESR